jgi:hypothetical protein
MTTIAVPELRRYAPDALRMVGIPLGQADETADMLVWTEAVTGGALRFVQSHRARLNWVPRPRPRVVRETPGEAVIDARGGSLLEFGIRIFDFVRAETAAARSRRVRVRVRNVYGAVFLPYLVARAAAQGIRIEYGAEGHTGLVLRATATGAAAEGLDTPAYRRAVERGIDIDERDFDAVTQLFEMLRVPTSERSRTHAG